MPDFIVTTVRSTSAYRDYPMGAWAAKSGAGHSELFFNYVGQYWGVHAIGEVWAEILWVIEQEFTKKHGFADTLFPPQPDENGDIPKGDFYHKKEHRANATKKPLRHIRILSLVYHRVLMQPLLAPFLGWRCPH
ncbi:uncharacterized protein EI90DRAFT_3127773 [Cantharellus anzutake]|uniref:uncharacterized protein n=1 Tax=Cantharellus anzutake TaxID=1750568 RepID=UPI001907B91C|nr:uncharacterized protein EI90DRAFT_3127773 [Cantharellus anzutake]KAF8326577.1 hypothetical protein EI90DRAFT_3127773 [Cantharellus anzutake]